MAATNKTDLLSIHEKEYSKLSELIASVDSNYALLKDEDGTSIKDIVAHRAHWIALFLGWYTDGQAGKTVYFPAEGYKWNELTRYNTHLRATQADMDWNDAKTALQSAFDTLSAFIKRHSDRDLYGGPMKGANNDWTPGRWAEAAGPSHFRSAAKYIRARLRASQNG